MADFGKVFANTNANEGATQGLYSDFQQKRKRRAALLASTRLGSSTTFNPGKSRADYGLSRDYNATTGKWIEPQYISDETRGPMQKIVDTRKLARIANDSANAANFLTHGTNMEMAYDDLNHVGEITSAFRRMGAAVDTQYDELNLGNRLDLNMEQMRQIRNSGLAFSEIFAENVERAALGEDLNIMPDALEPLTLGVDTVVDYATSRLSRLFRGEEGQNEALAAAAADSEELLRRIAEESEERGVDFKGSRSFEERSEAFGNLPEAANLWESVKNITKFTAEAPWATLNWGLQTAGESAPGIAASIATLFVTRSPNAARVVMGGSSMVRSRAGAFEELVAEGGYDISTPEGRAALMEDPKLPRLFRDQAATYGAVVGIIDALSAGAGSAALSKNVAGDFFLQMATQAVMGSSGELFGRMAANMPIDWNEVILEGFIEMVTGPFEVAGTAGPRAVFKQARKIENTNQRRKFFRALGESASESKLRDAAPEKYRELIDTVTKDGPVEDIYINPDDMDQMFQSSNTTEEDFFAALPQLSRQKFQEARESGTDYKIPTGVYASQIIGSSMEGELAPHIRFGALEMSMAEAQNITKRISESMDDIVGAAEQVERDSQELSAEAAEQFEEMTSAIARTGRFTRQAAAQQALPMAQFLDARAARSGVSVAEIARRTPLPSVAAREWQAPAMRTLPRVDTAPIFDAILGEPSEGTDGLPNVAAVRRRLTASGITEPTNTDVRRALVQAVDDGEIVGRLDDEAVMGPTDIVAEGEELMQTVTLRDGSEDLAQWGLDVPQKTRELALKLQARQRKVYGKTNRKQRGPKTVQKMAQWMADEIEFELQTPDKSALGWYGPKFQSALDTMAQLFPELTDQTTLDRRNRPLPGVQDVADVRALVTMILAITSNGQKVMDNYRTAVRIYRQMRVDGDLENALPKAIRGGDMAMKLLRMQQLAEERGGYDAARQYLLEEITVSQMNKDRKAQGLNATSGMPANMIVPRAAVEFGPKLGAFYANLSGSTGYLTMDMWWTRTINRYRGDVLPSVSGLRTDPLTTTGKPKGLHRFKLLINRPDLTDNQALNYVTEYRQRYKDREYKDGSLAEKAANTLYKDAFEKLAEQPDGAADRAFMLDVAQAARREVEKRTGQPITIADVQATIWYYEKRLYADMGVRDSGDISFDEAANRVVQLENSTKPDEGMLTLNQTATAPAPQGPRLPSLERTSPGPVPGVREVATKYMKQAGLPVRHQADYVKVDVDRAQKIAAAYDAMADTPNDPKVQAAYSALAEETLAQYEALLELGLKFEYITDTDPYSSPRDALIDMQENQHLWVFPTDSGFGTQAITAEQEASNPMLAMTKYTVDGQPARVNDIFRIVHDVFGHGSEGAAFGPRGEENAWQAHVRMFSPLAARAMTTETRGQNSWVNYGPFGEQNRSFPKDTIFADQKQGLLPTWVSTIGQGEDRAEAEMQPAPVEEADTELFQTPLGGVASLEEFNNFPLEAFQSDGWFIVSPNTQLEPDRADAMRAKLEALGYPYQELQGVYMGDPDGTSFLALGPRWMGLALGREYGQESVLTSRGLEYTDGSSKRPVKFDDVLTGDQARAQENHSIRLSDGEAFSLNLLWPEEIKPGLVDGRYYGAVLEDDGRLRMIHWSDNLYDTIDPQAAGTGPLRGEERRRRQVKGSYYGLNIGRPNGYSKENLGPYKHEVLVDPTTLYPFYEDPDGLKAKIPADTQAQQKVGVYEELIRDAGYAGYMTTQGELGMVAKSFVPLEVTRSGGETEFYQNGPQPTFKSALADGIANAKQAKASPKEWLAILGKMPGVRATERWFSGVDAYLETMVEENPKQQITRDQLYEWVSANQIELEVDTEGSEFFSYTEPGAEEDDYRVVKITVPNLDKIGPNAAYRTTPFVEAGHFQTPNIVVHARVTMRDGVFFIEEVQSDLNNRWRKSGEDAPGPGEVADTAAAEERVKEAELRQTWAGRALYDLRRTVSRQTGRGPVRDAAMGVFNDLHDAKAATDFTDEGRRARDQLSGIIGVLSNTMGDADRLSRLVVRGGRFMGTDLPPVKPGDHPGRVVGAALVDAIAATSSRRGDEADMITLLTGPDGVFTRHNARMQGSTETIEELHSSMEQLVTGLTEFDVAERAAVEAREALGGRELPAPITPFADASAIELAMKQLIRMAAEEGATAISWTPAEMQGRRWQQQVGEVRSAVRTVRWDAGFSLEGADGQKRVMLSLDERPNVAATVNAEGVIVGGDAGLEGQPLSALIGESLAERVLAEPEGQAAGGDIVFTERSGEGFINVYDRQIKKFVEKFAKKNGGKLEVNDSVLPSPDAEASADEARNLVARIKRRFNLPFTVSTEYIEEMRRRVPSSEVGTATLSEWSIYGPRLSVADAGAFGAGKPLSNMNAIEEHVRVLRRAAEPAGAVTSAILAGNARYGTYYEDARRQSQEAASRAASSLARELDDLEETALDTRRRLAEEGPPDPDDDRTVAIQRRRRAYAEAAEAALPDLRARAEAVATALQSQELENAYAGIRFFRRMSAELTSRELRSLAGVPEPDTAGPPVWYAEITDQMRSSAMEPWAMFQRGEKAPQGSLILPPVSAGGGQAQMNLFEGANLSTVLHEGGHYFLWVLQTMAGEGDTSAQQEMEALTRWWVRNAEGVAADAGVGEPIVRKFFSEGTTGDPDLDAKVNVGMHEQFARGYEAYLMEGKSPSNILRAAFESFTAWLLSVYNSALDLNVNLDDEVRGVFDRLLATDEQLAEARADNNIDDEIARTAREMGLDEESYRKLVELGVEARDEAKQMALKDVMAPIFRERKDEVKRRRAELTESVTAEVQNKKHNRVIQWLGNGRWIGGTAPETIDGIDLRMDTEMLREEYPEIDIRKLPRGSRPLHVKGSLVQADEVAEWFGYKSGSSMLEDLVTAPDPEAEIKSRVDAQIKEEFGDTLTDGSLQQKAIDALHGDKRGQVIVAELRALNRISSRKHEMTSKQQARAIARGMISQMKVRDAIKSHDFLGAERRHAERAARALAEGNTDLAFENKRKQLINHALYSESRAASEELGKVERLSARLRKRGTRKNLAGEYLSAIDDVLWRYDFRKISGAEEGRRQGLIDWIDMMKRQKRDNEIAVPYDVLRQTERKPYKTLTMQHLRGVGDTLKNIEHSARSAKKLRDAAAARDMDAVVADITAAFQDNVKGKPPARFPTKTSRVIDGVKEYVNLAINTDTILRRIDGWKIGAAVTNLKRSVDEAEINALNMRQEATAAFERLYSVYSRGERSQMAVKRQINGIAEPMSKWDVISAMLNTGNVNNYQRLTDPDAKFSFTEAQVETLTEQLDGRDWRFIESAWRFFDPYWEKIKAREERVTGVAPKQVEAAMQVDAPAGVTGGYYPIVYDGSVSTTTAAEQAEDIFTNMQGGRFGKAQTADGHLQERQKTGGGRSLRIGMEVMDSHILKVIHDLAFSEAVNNTWKILQDNRVKALFEDNGMVQEHSSLETWVQDVATGQIQTSGILGRVARGAKNGFTLSKLAFNMSTVAVQITGMTQSMALVGSGWMAKGYGQYLAGGVFPAAEKIMARSPFMAERETTFQRDMYDLFNEVSNGPLESRYKEARTLMVKWGFWMMQKVQFYAVDVPTWIGAYERALAGGQSEADAAYEADRMVARAQSSGLFADRSAIERGTLTDKSRQNDFVRLFTALGSYMFAKLNVASEVIGRTEMTPSSIAKTITDLSLLFMIEAIAYAFIKGTLPGMGEDEGDDEDTWAQFLARETSLTALSMFPFVRDMVSALQGFGGGGAYGGVFETIAKGTAAGASGISQLIGTAEDGEELTPYELRNIIDLVGLGVPGIPSTAINRVIRVEQARGEGEDVSPLNYIMGLPR